MVQARWVSQPEDIADAIWSAVREGKSEVIVGQPMTATEALQVAVRSILKMPIDKLLLVDRHL